MKLIVEKINRGWFTWLLQFPILVLSFLAILYGMVWNVCSRGGSVSGDYKGIWKRNSTVTSFAKSFLYLKSLREMP